MASRYPRLRRLCRWPNGEERNLTPLGLGILRHVPLPKGVDVAASRQSAAIFILQKSPAVFQDSATSQGYRREPFGEFSPGIPLLFSN